PWVTIQLPIYNELYVAERLIRAVSQLDYPRDRLEIQVLDDSTDETTGIIATLVAELQTRGYHIQHIRRQTRGGFKAGALKHGLTLARGEFIAIFDADFIPRPDFLQKTLPYFQDPKVGVVQTRWEHLNAEYSFFTQAQAIALDGYFVVEQQARERAGLFITFNGTGGIWRRHCIEDAGNWREETLAEDLDLSYRAQLRGWKGRYLVDCPSPAELPSDINALKAQQFRWAKGTMETARFILPLLWRSPVPLPVKLQSTLHLTNGLIFPCIIVTSLLHVPLVFLKNHGSYGEFFAIMPVFVLAFLGSFLFYALAQKVLYPDWWKRILFLPLFMAGSIGFAVNNTHAIGEALLKRRSEFVRTPKFCLEGREGEWIDKKYRTAPLPITLYLEAFLALYALLGLVILCFFDPSAIPFQLLFVFGFSVVTIASFYHHYQVSRHSSHPSSLLSLREAGSTDCPGKSGENHRYSALPQEPQRLSRQAPFDLRSRVFCANGYGGKAKGRSDTR
ncbi:MAG: glycosyltransferase, partial [Nitrospinota bacterium]